MNTHQKSQRIFGSINHLRQPIPWTTGLSNVIELLLWEPSMVLGINKKPYIRQIIDWSISEEMADKTADEIEKIVSKKLSLRMMETEQLETYSKKTTGISKPQESLRRIRYFSEAYLNTEFDIFLNLCSDKYLDEFYSQFMTVDKGHQWSTHGNGILFTASTELSQMYIDNIAYNEQANILVGNELKLGGQKNPDQILKYCLMYNHLIEKKFINKGTQFLLLFIGSKDKKYDKKTLIEAELLKCVDKAHLNNDDIKQVIEHINIAGTTWQKIIEFNKQYLEDKQIEQVEQKLLTGFNSTLESKAFLQ